MKHRELLHIAVAESSVIIRSGILAVLKRIPDMNIQTIEITSMEGLENCMLAHRPDIIIVNPYFQGLFNVEEFRRYWPSPQIRIVAMLSNMTDASLLKGYDGNMNIYDEIPSVDRLIRGLIHHPADEDENPEQESLSQREKEIICRVVKGMTNKEIADSLYLSIHTVITHRRNIARKLQIHSPAGLTIYAIVNKLIDISDVKING